MNETFTILGWTWMGVTTLCHENGDEPVLGFEVWADYVASRVRASDPTDWKSRSFIAFKNALSELESLGAIERSGAVKERKRTRLLWKPTDKGHAWWQETGLDLHGPDRTRDDRGLAEEPPMGKWVNLRDANAATRRRIMSKLFNGQWDLALRDASDVPSDARGKKKTGGS